MVMVKVGENGVEHGQMGCANSTTTVSGRHRFKESNCTKQLDMTWKWAGASLQENELAMRIEVDQTWRHGGKQHPVSMA